MHRDVAWTGSAGHELASGQQVIQRQTHVLFAVTGLVDDEDLASHTNVPQKSADPQHDCMRAGVTILSHTMT